MSAPLAPRHARVLIRLAPPAPCPTPGCGALSARWIERLPEAFRPLCARCRQDAQTYRARHPACFAEEAVAHVADLGARRAFAAAARCPVCAAPAEPYRAGTAPELRALCPTDRQRARLLLAKRRATPATVLARLLSPRARRSLG